MPILRKKHDNTKVYRPDGTRFVEAESRRCGKSSRSEILYDLVDSLEEAFVDEFDELPDGVVVLEFVFTDANVTGTMFEIKE